MKTTSYILFLLLFPLTAYSIQFEDLPEFNIEFKYQKGDMIRFGNNIYIHQPDKNWHKIVSAYKKTPENISTKNIIASFGKKAQLQTIESWSARKHYQIGNSIFYQNKYYTLIKKTKQGKWKEKHWLPFDHPAIGYDLPEYDENSNEFNSLIGTDKNLNLIRDDFEVHIKMSRIPEQTKEYALKAGKIYTNLMLFSNSQHSVSAENAKQTLGRLIQARLCKQSFSDIAWKESSFFNTFDRIKFKFIIQENLYTQLDSDEFDIENINPCEQLAVVMENEK